MFGHWLNAVDRQRGDTEAFCHWIDTVDRQRAGTETFGFWLDTLNASVSIMLVSASLPD